MRTAQTNLNHSKSYCAILHTTVYTVPRAGNANHLTQHLEQQGIQFTVSAQELQNIKSTVLKVKSILQ